MQVCICMAGIVLGWVMVRVNGGESAGLLTFLQSKKVERVVLMVWERPHIRVDFLTVWNSIDKSSKTQPCVHACLRTVRFIQTLHRLRLSMSTRLTLKTLHFSLSLSFSHPVRLTLSHVQTCTHTFQRLSLRNVGQSCVGTKGSVTQLLSQPSLCPAFNATR